MGVVGGVHEHVVPEEVHDHLDHVLLLGHFDAGEEAPSSDVVHDLVLEVGGELRLDDGAVRALRDGSSLLPVGVVTVSGHFRRGDVVTLKDSSGTDLGRGLAEYSSEDAARLVGIRSEHIEKVLGYRERATMVHRDELVLFDND